MALKDLRTSKNWSQEDLAAISGLSVRTIQRIERHHKAGLESLKSLAAAFNINVDDLRSELETAGDDTVSDEDYANKVMDLYLISAVLILMLVFIFLPNALQDSSNWSAFAMMCFCYGVIIIGYAAVAFGESWQDKIISKRQ